MGIKSTVGLQNDVKSRSLAVLSFDFSTNGSIRSINAITCPKITFVRLLGLLVVVAGLAVTLPRAQAQLFVGIGLQAGYSKMPNANVPIDRYRSRGFFYKQMNHFHFPFGEIYAESYRQGRALLELNLNTRRMRATAKSTDAGGIYQKDIRFSIQSLSFGGGVDLAGQDKFAFYLGGSFDLGYARLLQRQGYTTQINRTPYGLFSRSPMMAVSIFTKMVFRDSPDAIAVWSLTPYIQLPLQTFNFQILDQVLNAGYLTPYPNPLPARPWNVGVAFNFDMDLLGFLMK